MFIGEKEIKSIEGRTVTFVDGTTKIYPEKKTIEIDVLEYIVTDEPKDASTYVSICTSRAAKDGLEVWRGHDINKVNINRTTQLQSHLYDMEFMTAVGMAFGTYEEGKHPDHFGEEICMSDFERIKSEYKKI